MRGAGNGVIDGGDTIDNAKNMIYGNSGDDTLRGKQGEDFLDGGSGNADLFGPGNDDLYGWSENDDLDGGTGSDDCCDCGPLGFDTTTNCEGISSAEEW